MSEPLSNTHWYIPWTNCERWDEQDVTSSSPKNKFLYYATEELKPECRGTGIIVEENSGTIYGCYKTQDATERGQQFKTDLVRVSGGNQFNTSDQHRILQIPENNRTKEQKAELAGLQAEAKEWPTEVRRLNGMLLDPRPQAIAKHESQILFVHPSMAGDLFKSYGDEYRALELRIRSVMGDTFNKKDHLPAWRQKDDEELKKDGLQLGDFGDQ